MINAKVVEVLGIPNSGKTRLSDEITGEMSRLGFNVRYIQDQIRDSHLPVDEVGKNIETVRRIGSLIADARSRDWDLILVEAGAYTRIASLRGFLKNKQFSSTKKDKERIRTGIKMALLEARQEDYFIFLEITAEAAWKRSQERGYREGRIINPASLSILEEIFRGLKSQIKRHRGAHRMRIVKNEHDFDSNVDKMIKFLISLICKNGDTSLGAK